MNKDLKEIVKQSYSKDDSLTGKQAQITKIGGFSQVGEILEAWKDAKGIIRKIRLRKSDGKFDWVDTGDSVVDVLNFSNRYFAKVWLLVKKWFVKDRIVAA